MMQILTALRIDIKFSVSEHQTAVVAIHLLALAVLILIFRD